MKKRSTEILQKIMKNPSRDWSIPSLAKTYGVSQRTLRNDLNEINDYMVSIDTLPLGIGHDGSLLIDASCNCPHVLDQLLQMDTYEYRLSSEERRIFLLSTLLCSSEYVSMQEIADSLFVSRITILSDLQTLQKALSEREIYVLSDQGKGMKLICTPPQRIDLMMLIYQQTTENIESEGFFQNYIFRRMQIKYPFSEVFEYLQEYAARNSVIFIDDVLHDLAVYLFAMFNTQGLQNQKDDPPSLPVSKDSPLEGLDYFLIYLGHKLDAPVTEDMLRLYRKYISANALHSFVKSVDEMELYKIIHYYLTEIDRDMNLHLTMDSLLLDSLLLHIKNMKNWGGYEVELPTAENIAVDYELLQESVEKYAYILERFLGYSLSGNMKRSIVIHICVALLRNQRNASRLSVAVVCPGSMATGKYLESQIRNYFDFNIVGVISSRQVFRRLREQKAQVDFIVSTVPLESDEYKILTVHPSLTMKDLNRIQEAAFLSQKEASEKKPLLTNSQRMLSKVKDLIEENDIPSSLRNEMESLISIYEKESVESRFSAVGKLLHRDHISITYEDLTWRDAMRLSARILVQKGFIDQEYIETSIRNVEQYGDYIVIGDGIALAHANSENGVSEDCLSLLVCPTGVSFSDEDRIVYMIFCFASTGKKEYVDLLQEIMLLSVDETLFRKMVDMNEEELFQTLQ